MSFMAVVIIQMREGERSSMGFSPESQSSHAQTSYYATATEGGMVGPTGFIWVGQSDRVTPREDAVKAAGKSGRRER